MLKIILALSLIAGAWFHGSQHGKGVERLLWQIKVQRATDVARAAEKQRQESVNNAIQKQYDDLAGINNSLVRDLNRLRSRPTRNSMPGNTAVTCKGATGRELSAEDASFLTREAARADRHRAAVAACYAYADSL